MSSGERTIHPVTPVCRTAVSSPAAWRGADFASASAYTIDLAGLRGEIDAIVGTIRQRGATLENADPLDFPLAPLRPAIDRLVGELASGRGFALVRNLCAEGYSPGEMGMLYWLVGALMGASLPQNKAGDRLGSVTDRSYVESQARGYRTREEMTFHTDVADIVGLMCVRPARSGGASQIASALTIHNLLLEEHPELLDRLYAGYIYDRAGEGESADHLTDHRVPVYSNMAGAVSARLYRPLAEVGQAKAGAPFSDSDRQAFDFIEAAARRPGVMLEIPLQAGEILFLNNYTVLHARTGFEDFEEPAQKRLLFRLWLNRDGFRTTHPDIEMGPIGRAA